MDTLSDEEKKPYVKKPGVPPPIPPNPTQPKQIRFQLPTSVPNPTIYFTMDGSVPFPGRAGTLLYDPEEDIELPVGKYFIVRVRGFSPGMTYSPVLTSRQAESFRELT